MTERQGASIRICVFCGSSEGRDPAYMVAAERVGRTLAERGIGVVYGGGNIGLMGQVARAALDAGGEVIGVIPGHLRDREPGDPGVTRLHVVDTMHERKAMMSDLADAFLTLPGGLGTMEEVFEVATWSQLGLHAQPIGVLDVAGFYTPLASLLEHAVTEGFVRGRDAQAIAIDDDLDRLLDLLLRRLPD